MDSLTDVRGYEDGAVSFATLLTQLLLPNGDNLPPLVLQRLLAVEKSLQQQRISMFGDHCR